jgi:hypothetical protein
MRRLPEDFYALWRHRSGFDVFLVSLWSGALCLLTVRAIISLLTWPGLGLACGVMESVADGVKEFVR